MQNEHPPCFNGLQELLYFRSRVLYNVLITWPTFKNIMEILHFIIKNMSTISMILVLKVFLHVEFVTVYTFYACMGLWWIIWWAYFTIDIWPNRWFIFITYNEPVNQANVTWWRLISAQRPNHWFKICSPLTVIFFNNTRVI